MLYRVPIFCGFHQGDFYIRQFEPLDANHRTSLKGRRVKDLGKGAVYRASAAVVIDRVPCQRGKKCNLCPLRVMSRVAAGTQQFGQPTQTEGRRKWGHGITRTRI
jgi:hypothetical protein